MSRLVMTHTAIILMSYSLLWDMRKYSYTSLTKTNLKILPIFVHLHPKPRAYFHVHLIDGAANIFFQPPLP